MQSFRKIRNTFFFTAYLLSFAAAEISILSSKSEAKNAIFLGFSIERLLLAAAVLAGAAVFIVCHHISGKKDRLPVIVRLIGCLAALIPAGILLLALRDRENTIFSVLKTRALPVLLFYLVCGVLLLIETNGKSAQISATAENYLFVCAMILAVLGMLHCFSRISIEKNWDELVRIWLFLLIIAAAAGLFRVKKPENPVSGILSLLFICTAAFAAIRTVQFYMGRTNTPSSAYWAELAESFLHGKLYLEHPAGFHDLTFYNGQWYVPNPPMPAVLLIPAVAVLGSAGKINMTVYSALIGAFNTGLIYVLLKKASERGGGRIKESGMLWLTAAFVFGGDHLWLSTSGQMWFISQLLVVSFTLLAVLILLRGGSPVWAGFCIGAAVLCRPNVFPAYLVLFGLYLYLERDNSFRIDKKTILWCLKSGLPVVFCVLVLLGYNRMRFGDFFDFGYKTINGASDIVAAANDHGLFSYKFLARNADIMLLRLPRLDFSGERFWFYPYVAGYSVLLMSPWLLFAFRNLKKNWWIIGSLSSLGLILIMLLLYHNTGAEQIGYRYILDAYAPLTLLVGNGMKGKAGKGFKITAVFSIVLQLISVYWWYLGRI